MTDLPKPGLFRHFKGAPYYVHRVLRDATNGADYAPIVVYGWYRDFGITIAYATRCMCSLDLEGLT